MSALRLARAYSKREKIIKFDGCYYGHADMLLVQAAGSGVATLGLSDSPGVPTNTVKDMLVADFNNLDSVEELFKKYPELVTAIILEHMTGRERSCSWLHRLDRYIRQGHFQAIHWR
jgi:glutamate-1-semialdehyde 2,1-aminomutase